MTGTAPNSLRIHGGRPLSGTATVPPDLEVLERALVVAGLAEGTSQLSAAPSHSRLAALAAALRAMGVELRWADDGLHVRGVGLHGLRMPSGALDCGLSFTSVGLVAGLLSAQPFGTRITAHAALATRSVDHIVGPLRARGAHIAGRSQSPHAAPTLPISVAPLVEGERLHALDCSLPVPDAVAKSAILVSALFAAGSTTITEPLVSADHMERLLVALGLPLRRIGAVVNFDPADWDTKIPPLGRVAAPGCVTCAAFACVAALLLPASRVALRGPGLNPSRTGFFDVLRMWGADVQVLPRGDTATREPYADIIVKHSAVRGGMLGGETLLRSREELGALAVLGQAAPREVQLFDLEHAAPAGDPHATELEGLLRAFGISARRVPGALCVGQGKVGAGAVVDAKHDPALAMTAIVLGLTTPGETVVEDAASAVEQAHPGFLDMLRELGAEIELR